MVTDAYRFQNEILHRLPSYQTLGEPDHHRRSLIWFPPAVKGEARRKVVSSLARHGLITSLGDDWQITAEGYDVAGVARPSGMPAPTVAVEKPAPRTRENSKLAAVIQMLQRPEGATIPQIMAVTSWQAHSARGYAGTIKSRPCSHKTSRTRQLLPECGEAP